MSEAKRTPESKRPSLFVRVLKDWVLAPYRSEYEPTAESSPDEKRQWYPWCLQRFFAVLTFALILVPFFGGKERPLMSTSEGTVHSKFGKPYMACVGNTTR